MGRIVIPLDNDWRFSRQDPATAMDADYDDSRWRVVRVPHDWAIEGPFDRNNDLQYTVITEDGEQKRSEHTGRTAGLPHVGPAWYRLVLPALDLARDARVYIEFDGAMSDSTVYCNGHAVGSWPFGYSSFLWELTETLFHARGTAGGSVGKNILAVRLDPKADSSRWYPGAGLYRHVRLVIVGPVHVAHWGMFARTEAVTDNKATVAIRTEIVAPSDHTQSVELVTTITDTDGSLVARDHVTVALAGDTTTDRTIMIDHPRLWGTTSPHLYTATTEIRANGEVLDTYVTLIGVREISWNKDGFYLNGERLELKGVCMHHDLGPLGAAVNRCALERQYRMLKEMGCNAVRTSHNPPAPEMLDVCDQLGLVVIDEAFDEWKVPKVSNGYHRLFDDWAEKDLRAMIRRDRNHPSVVMWSIGNEVRDQGSPEGAGLARMLTDVCHREDPSRPVTAGFNQSDDAIANGLAVEVDITGWNYKPHLYGDYRKAHPDWIQVGSETSSCVSSRGEYYFPVEREINPIRESLHVGSYDLASPPWGCPPDVEFAAQVDHPHILGEFVWTGFDYLGEPTPYTLEWPSRSSYFGIMDLCGFPKDRYYLYKSRWSGRPVLHLLPHWNWEGREGEITPVHCYTSYEAAELFVNGESQGVRRKDPSSVFDRFRLRWNEVRYQPGELRVVALDQSGNPVAEEVVRTSGPPKRLALTTDCRRFGTNDLVFLTVTTQDAEGQFCPRANDTISFEIEGPGRLRGVGSGDQTSVESFVAAQRRLFNGMCLAIVEAEKDTRASLTFVATAKSLDSARIELTAGGQS